MDFLQLETFAFSPSGRAIGIAKEKGTISLQRIPTGEMIWETRGHHDQIMQIAFSPDERLLATSSLDATARLWDVKSGQAIGVLRGAFLALFGLAFSPDGQRLAGGTGDGRIYLWDVTLQSEVAVLKMGSYQFIWSIHFADNDTLAACTFGQAIVWRAPSLIEIAAAQNLSPTGR